MQQDARAAHLKRHICKLCAVRRRVAINVLVRRRQRPHARLVTARHDGGRRPHPAVTATDAATSAASTAAHRRVTQAHATKRSREASVAAAAGAHRASAIGNGRAATGWGGSATPWPAVTARLRARH